MVYLLSVCAFGVMSVSFGFWEKYTEVLKKMNKILFCGMHLKGVLEFWVSSEKNVKFLLVLVFSIKNVVVHKDATMCGFNKKVLWAAVPCNICEVLSCKIMCLLCTFNYFECKIRHLKIYLKEG